MDKHKRLLLPIIEESYDKFTGVERNIADFFLNNNEEIVEMSSKAISNRLFVSEASLSRFAKKCGFKGFREFLFYYENKLNDIEKDMDETVQVVFDVYRELLNKSIKLVKADQLFRIANKLRKYKKIFVYGIGSSRIIAEEFKLKFIETSLLIEAITDSYMMKMNSFVLDSETLLIGITLSKNTNEIVEFLKAAKKKNTETILLTAYSDGKYEEFCDEIVMLSAIRNCKKGTEITSEFPALVVIDILYSYFRSLDEG